MKNIKTFIKEHFTYFDGGFGTLLQEMGLPKGTPPELWNLTHREKVTEIHKRYIASGSNIITTNTFGINADEYQNYEQLITAAVDCAKDAANDSKDVFIAFDVGPTGRMLEPLGDLSFEDAVSLFSKNIKIAANNKVDLIIIETMNDSYETKAAVLAAKESCDLPIFVTNVYDKSGKLMTGANPKAMIAMLEGLGVDAIGMNCSFGPDKMLEIIDDFITYSSLPIIANPNAGLPKVENGKTVFDIGPENFSEYMEALALKGVTILGGCCGTTPEYIKETVNKTKSLNFKYPESKNHTLVSSYTHAVEIKNEPILIGERINPTGKPKLKEALRNNNINYLLNEGIRQAEKGVHILDVNVGLPEIDEAQIMYNTVKELQAVSSLPLQLDSSSPEVLERSMRIYNGKPLINSVNGEEESMNAVFSLVKKYGGSVIALTMDKNGIPNTAEQRLSIAKRIAEVAKEYGISKKDLIIDPLCLTVSSDTNSALVTLKAVRLLKENGFKTSLGVSNISFGLPERQKINTAFFSLALENGLNCAIMNPFSSGMMDVYYSFRLLHGLDTACSDYISYTESAEKSETPTTISGNISLTQAIIKGLKENALSETINLLNDTSPLDIINSFIIPALNSVGKGFEQKKIYLPQLLMSAEAATTAFDTVKEKMPKDQIDLSKAIILATVKGDIHDIGKNIVKVLLESYGFNVYDLGKDVSPEEILEKVIETDCKLVGLSALMTTTVPSMEETIKLLKKETNGVKVVVGGAVLTQEYADMISADRYCADAMDAVRFAEEFYSNNSQ